MTGRVLGASGFLLVFWVAVSEKPVGPNSGYLYNAYNFLESLKGTELRGFRVQGVRKLRSLMCHTHEQSSLPMLLLLLWSYIVIRLEGLREKGSGLEGIGFRKLRSLMCHSHEYSSFHAVIDAVVVTGSVSLQV